MEEQEQKASDELLEQIIKEFSDSPEDAQSAAAADEVSEDGAEESLEEDLIDPEDESSAPPEKTPAAKPRRPWLYYTLIVIFSAVFVCCAVYIGSYMVEIYRAAKDYDYLASLVDQSRQTEPAETVLPTFGITDNPDPTGTDPAETLPPTILSEYQAIYDLNNELVGWLTIADTKINYPVLQSAVDNKDYYLYRDIYGDDSRMGAIYVRETCDVFTPSDNVTIYGHCMKTGEMFGTLSNYTKQSYWEAHPCFTFDTIYEHHTYQIFAVFKTSANLGEGFAYHQFENAENEEAFNAFVSTIKEMAFYDTGITPVYGDKLVCLSTCEYTLDNGRLVVVGVRIS